MLQKTPVTNPSARVGGERASYLNMPISSNPYQVGSTDYDEWQSGWNDANNAKTKPPFEEEQSPTKSMLFS